MKAIVKETGKLVDVEAFKQTQNEKDVFYVDIKEKMIYAPDELDFKTAKEGMNFADRIEETAKDFAKYAAELKDGSLIEKLENAFKAGALYMGIELMSAKKS